jgi:putative methionine-R-sulfoxide reductase with GAF domain
MVAPVGDGNELAGLVALYSTRPDAFAEKDLHLLQDFQQDIAARLQDVARVDSDRMEDFTPQRQNQVAGVPSQIVCGLS